MIILDLCSGSGSVSRSMRAMFPEANIISFDLLNFPPMDENHKHVQGDIRNVDFSTYEDVHILWASPPCEHYSSARTTARTERDFQLYDSIVQKVLEAIRVTNPKKWFMENPGGAGLLHRRPFMQPFEKYRRETTYCMWGTKYMKPTSIWSNTLLLHGGLPRCTKSNPCQQKVGTRHPQVGQTGKKHTRKQEIERGWNQAGACTKTLWKVPEGLIRMLVALPVPPTDTP